MPISTNSVIHYTERIDNLKGIVDCSGFRLKYCLEEITIKKMNPISGAYPMVSFCDIPLSEVKNHIDTYGSYGIGLSKTWAKQTGLNPVLYIEQNSRFAQILDTQADRLIEQDKQDKQDKDLLGEFFNVLSYSKNYEGHLVKGKINSDTYRFYDEREWRFVAIESDINDLGTFILDNDYLKDKQSFNEKIKDCFVKFSFRDISYLIVNDEDEIPEILKSLNDAYEDQATSKELKVLSTKILTKNQIWNDF